MPDYYAWIAALAFISACAALLIGSQLVSIMRDTDAWVIVRGVVRGRYDQLRRTVGARRG